MWKTIADFRENLSQIASDVLDTAEELEIGGSQNGATPHDQFDHLLQRRRQRDSDLQAQEHRFEVGLQRLQQAESSMSTNHLLALQEKEDELFRLHEENAILKKLLRSAPERGPVSNGALINAPNFEGLSKDDLLREQHGKDQNASHTKNMPDGSLSRIKDLELQNRRLQAMERDLSSQISEKNLAYASLEDSHTKSLAEIRNLKEVLKKEREDLACATSKLQRDSNVIEAANREKRQLNEDKHKMSLEILEVKRRLDEQIAEISSNKYLVRDEILKEMESTLLLKDEKVEQLQRLMKDLEKENLQLQDEVKRLKQSHGHHQLSLAREDNHVDGQLSEHLREVKTSLKQKTDILKDAEEACGMKLKEYERNLDAVRAERDKALRDLKRLKQHLIEKEQADSEKMDQDSEKIIELQERVDASTLRVLQLEETLAQTLANQMEVNKKNNEQLQESNMEVSQFKKKLDGCIKALDSKDIELRNLQIALGQYYAEIEAKDRLHGELSASRSELALLSENLKAANSAIELKTKETEEALRQLALQKKIAVESQEKMHKLEADILMLQRALEQSLSRLNRMCSDSDSYVDRRIVIKLLVTYFQRHQSKEVLDLMVRMLGFSEEDKQAIYIAQQGGNRGVVRGVLGLPGRVVGGLLKTGSSPSVPSTLQTENQSFADLWIDFLLKESEREAITGEAKTDGVKQSISSPRSAKRSEASGNSIYSDTYGRASITSGAPFTNLSPSVNGPSSISELSDPVGSEFSTVPLNSALSPPLVGNFRYSRASLP